jgi:YVTN family beta-propeller protein
LRSDRRPGPPLVRSGSGAVVNTISVGNDPLAVSSDGTHVWVVNFVGNTVTELDASSGAYADGSLAASTISVGDGPQGISSDGTDVWVANYFGSTVTELDAASGAVVNTISVGSGPQGISSDGTHVWTTNYYSGNTVSEIALNFAIVIPSLPSATPGTSYGPVTLQAVNVEPSVTPYTTTLKWKKISLPKGLRFSAKGVLSGKPRTTLAAGPSSFTVSVTETVTPPYRRRPVRQKTTVQATIPLTIN